MTGRLFRRSRRDDRGSFHIFTHYVRESELTNYPVIDEVIDLKQFSLIIGQCLVEISNEQVVFRGLKLSPIILIKYEFFFHVDLFILSQFAKNIAVKRRG